MGNKQRKRIRCIRIREEKKVKGDERKGNKQESKSERKKKRVPLLSKIYGNRTVGFRRSES